MSALLLHVSTVVVALIYHKDIDAHVHLDFREKIVKKKRLIARPIHAQLVQCAKTSPDMETILVSVEAATLETTAMLPLIHVQRMEIHVQMALLVLH